MNKKPFRVAVLFSVIVFLILALTLGLNALLVLLLLKLNIIVDPRPELALPVFAVVSVIVGTILSHVVGKRPLSFILAIDNATKEVVKGNFNMRLDENIPAWELHSMAHNFNTMVKELAGTEIFRKDFIENVSHEFKTPLSAIEGYAALLQKKSLPEEKRVEYTNRILLNTRRLSALTGNILLLSRLENQGMEVSRETYSLDEQLREAVLLFEQSWTAKSLDLDIDLCPVDYNGNKELLAQVWQNLLDNAIKFVPDNGMIRVLLRQEAGAVQISVVDNGPGMNQEVLHRVYEKFYQGDASRTSSGNGLGLALVKRIVDLHGGSIQVSSKEGRGTTFAVNLPIPVRME